MKKPKQRTHLMYDYHECAEYVAHKLNIKDLRDTLGKFKSNPYDDTIEYRDYWHYVLDKNGNVSNGAQVWIFEDEDGEPWQQEITKVFLDEFGDGPYWVSW